MVNAIAAEVLKVIKERGEKQQNAAAPAATTPTVAATPTVVDLEAPGTAGDKNPPLRPQLPFKASPAKPPALVKAAAAPQVKAAPTPPTTYPPKVKAAPTPPTSPPPKTAAPHPTSVPPKPSTAAQPTTLYGKEQRPLSPTRLPKMMETKFKAPPVSKQPSPPAEPPSNKQHQDQIYRLQEELHKLKKHGFKQHVFHISGKRQCNQCKLYTWCPEAKQCFSIWCNPCKCQGPFTNFYKEAHQGPQNPVSPPSTPPRSPMTPPFTVGGNVFVPISQHVAEALDPNDVDDIEDPQVAWQFAMAAAAAEVKAAAADRAAAASTAKASSLFGAPVTPPDATASSRGTNKHII